MSRPRVHHSGVLTVLLAFILPPRETCSPAETPFSRSALKAMGVF